MAVTYFRLSGTRENLDETIRDLLSDEWTAANITGTITPTFLSDSNEPDGLARPDHTAPNEVRVNYIRRIPFAVDQDPQEDPLGDTVHYWWAELNIDISGETLNVMIDMEDEINRILWENRPNGATNLNKSDGSASEALLFEHSEIEFERIEPEDDVDYKPSSVGTLRIKYARSKT